MVYLATVGAVRASVERVVCVILVNVLFVLFWCKFYMRLNIATADVELCHNSFGYQSSRHWGTCRLYWRQPDWKNTCHDSSPSYWLCTRNTTINHLSSHK